MSQFEYEDNSYTQPLHPDALLDMVLVAMPNARINLGVRTVGIGLYFWAKI